MLPIQQNVRLSQITTSHMSGTGAEIILYTCPIISPLYLSAFWDIVTGIISALAIISGIVVS